MIYFSMYHPPPWLPAHTIVTVLAKGHAFNFQSNQGISPCYMKGKNFWSVNCCICNSQHTSQWMKTEGKCFKQGDLAVTQHFGETQDLVASQKHSQSFLSATDFPSPRWQPKNKNKITLWRRFISLTLSVCGINVSCGNTCCNLLL